MIILKVILYNKFIVDNTMNLSEQSVDKELLFGELCSKDNINNIKGKYNL